MQFEAKARRPLTGQASESACIKRERFGRIVGFGPRSLDAGHVAKLRQRSGRFETPDEIREARAVVEQNGRSRRLQHHKLAGHSAKEFVTNNATGGGEIGL